MLIHVLVNPHPHPSPTHPHPPPLKLEYDIIKYILYYRSCWCYMYSAPHELYTRSWWRHQMEAFSALLAICAGNSPVTGEFPTQMPGMRSVEVFFDLRPNKRLSKQSWGLWFETPSWSLWRHCNVHVVLCFIVVVWYTLILSIPLRVSFLWD